MMKKSVKISWFVIGLTLILYLFLQRDFKRTEATLYTNGNIITLDENQAHAEAMFVKDGKIIAIGSNKDLEKYTSKSKSVVDLKGATILPGFIDPHTHFSISMLMSEMHDLSGFTHSTNQEVWSEFENIVANSKKGEWLIFKGIDPVLVDDLVPPSMEYLDKIAPENPILLFSQSLHNYWTNSKAFERVGIDKNTPDPSNHSFYGKDKNGNLDGSIVEQEAFQPFLKILKDELLSPKNIVASSSKVMSDYVKNGNTSIVSVGITIQDKKPLMLYKYLSSEKIDLLGSLLQKIGMFPKRQQRPRHFIYMRHDMAHLMPEHPEESDDFYNIIGIKQWYDGSPYIGSMYLNSAYLNSDFNHNKLHIPKDSKGKALVQKDSLKDFIRKYHNKGWQISLHTQGDAAINEVVEIFEELETELDFSASRHRLEHCLLLPSESISKMAKLHLTPSFHINHLYYYGDALKNDILGEQRAEKILPIQSIAAQNIKYSLHADQPMFDSHPFRLIQTAVERKTRSGDVIGENQKITLLEAIKSLTIYAAWQIHMEDKIGSLKQGKYADFIILDKDPFKTDISELGNIKCLKTFINGNLAQ